MKNTEGSYKEIHGNIINLFFEGRFEILVHGCNCHQAMGGGLAYQIAQRIPKAELKDTFDQRTPIERLGDMTVAKDKTEWHTGFGFIINLYSQYNPGRSFDIEALTLGLRKVGMHFKGDEIGLPLIGCGIAGGDWRIVKEIIKRELAECHVTIVHYKA